MPDLKRNKAHVIAFYDLAFNQGRPREAMERYAGAEYIQHNPASPPASGASSIISRRPSATIPACMRAIAEGNYVVLHCRQEFPGDHVWAAIDIFRLNGDGKIPEHWDVLQIVPDEAANPNGMF